MAVSHRSISSSHFFSSSSSSFCYFLSSEPLHLQPLLSARPATVKAWRKRRPISVAKWNGRSNKQPIYNTRHVVTCINQTCGAIGEGAYAVPENGDMTNAGDTALPAKRQSQHFSNAFWRFLRPHTVRGTLIGTTALVARALLENVDRINWVLLPKASSGLLALICGNGYIVGINQIYDVDIDKVNKPFLPIASGDLSSSAAWLIILALAAIGIGIVAINFGSLITTLYMLGLLLGAIYSVPPLRFKQFPVAAFLIIATVRGFLLNFGVYYATRTSLGLAFEWSPPVVFITVFVTIFAIVIAITKDLPDIEGDMKYKISTFATKLGVRNIALLGSGLLLANYAGAIAAASHLPQFFRPEFMALWHAILAGIVIYQEAIASFYRFIWNLLYAEYAMFPFL
ncbi:hypothetical protein O6H91_06G023800 [Diphasiastrum complanatum]|uniref:Uncharacterized protein n=1 Tax=Diphasiastrum complanatum TaxID=34168 RepID=A0ACC2DC34_DIPCM|nr:hypothetical protein O6H91_06G023800 [Diphasiastrum complanatum]